MINTPTPAEAMALWYSLDRPSSYEVAARFTAAGRPIRAQTISRWKKQGWQRFAKPPRADMPTPAEVQAIWNSLENPSLRKVADAFKAQGRPVCTRTIWKWKQAGWSRVTAKTVVAKAARVIEKIPAAPAPTNDAAPGLAKTHGRDPRVGAGGALTSDRPTPAEAMALWYSLEKPTGREVAARLNAAGRSISARTITQWKKEGWRGVAHAPRTDKPRPAEAKAIWESLERPTFRQVAEEFKAQGRTVCPETISNWHRQGWSGVNPKNVVGKINRAIEKIAAALPALTGDATSTLSDILTGHEAVTDERKDDERRNHQFSNAEYAEHAILRAIRTATAVNDAIHDIAAAVPKPGAEVPKDAPLPLLLTQPQGIAQLMMASNAGVGVSIEGMRQLPALRAEEAAAVPGAQTIYPPGHGRYAEISHADDFNGEQDYPSRSTIEAIDQALKKFREGKT